MMAMTGSPRLLVLYARSDALGDGLMRIPAIRAARSAFPSARLIYGTEGETSLASPLRRHVDGVVDEIRTRRSLAALLRELAPARGETAVADFRTVAGWLVAARMRLLGSGIRYEGNFPGYALSWLAQGFGIRPEHNAWRYHRVIERLAGRALPFDHRLAVLESAREQARGLRADDSRPLVLLGANSAPHKALTAEQLAPVAADLLQGGFDVVYLQSPGAGPNAAGLSALVPELRTVGPADEVPGVPLLEVFLALGEVAAAYVGPEGGLGHCMAAVGAPIVLINHGALMERWRPLTGTVEVVDARTSSPTGRSADTPPGVILEALDRLLVAQQRHHARRAGGVTV